ncbi:hypothetical protein GCM10009096_07840 [Parasphingorhabdus litoris]|uniref:Anti-sigma-28 factor FlgM C-terminal domain-containing protein n=1 Tax=Parasphingorhabdus litoris TaxID=394733 RepID=A0ABN1A7B6_9SPHN|nr:hypothetical protein [Parasphingorhabdus litoris]
MIDRINASRSSSVNTGKVNDTQPMTKPVEQNHSEVDNKGISLAKAVEQMVQQGMPVNVAHIQFVTEAIANDRYPIDSMMIAEKIIAFDRPEAGSF